MTVTINTIAGDDFINADESDQGVTFSGTVSNLIVQTLRGTVHFKILDGTGTAVFSRDVDPTNGIWSVTYDASGLGNGSYTVSADTSDDFDPAATRAFTIDVTRPAVTGITLSDTDLARNDTALVTITLSQPSSDFSLSNIHTEFGGGIFNFTQVDALTYTVTLFAPLGTEGRNADIEVDTNWHNAAGNKPADSFTSGTYNFDAKPPSGSVFFASFVDTGTHDVPVMITANNNPVIGVNSNDLNPADYDLQQSVDGGAFVPFTGSSFLPDGDYRYRAILHDTKGNSATTNVIEIIIDTTPAVAGTLGFANLIDTGSADAPPVTTSTAFDLALAGTESGASVSYEVSTDGGATWAPTTTAQSGLADGTYHFHALAEDAAGNVGTSNDLVIIVDHVAAPGTVSFANLIDTGGSDATPITTDNAFDLTLSGGEPGSAAYQVSTDHGATWSTTGASQSGLADATYLFRALFTDRAGNSALTDATAVTIDHHAPAGGTLSFANLADENNGVTSDNTFDLVLSGAESGASVLFQMSGDHGATWLTTTTSQSALAEGAYQFRAFVSDAAGNIGNSNTLAVTVAHDPGNTPTGNPPVDNPPVDNGPPPVPRQAPVPIVGTNGDDNFAAQGGDSSFVGLSGTDTITFNFKLVDATISFAGNQIIIDGPNGISHTITNGIEVFNFQDGTVNERDGNPLVDDLFYYSGNHDVWTAHVDADAHFLNFGWKEGRDPNGWFDTKGYLAHNPDVAAAGLNPLTHYDLFGFREGRDPSARFDTKLYLSHYPDVAAAHVDPLAHFLSVGIEEGRMPFSDGVWG